MRLRGSFCPLKQLPSITTFIAGSIVDRIVQIVGADALASDPSSDLGRKPHCVAAHGIRTPRVGVREFDLARHSKRPELTCGARESFPGVCLHGLFPGPRNVICGSLVVRTEV